MNLNKINYQMTYNDYICSEVTFQLIKTSSCRLLSADVKLALRSTLCPQNVTILCLAITLTAVPKIIKIDSCMSEL